MAGLGWEKTAEFTYEAWFGWGTFNFVSEVAAWLIAVILSTVIETFVLWLVFRAPVDAAVDLGGPFCKCGYGAPGLGEHGDVWFALGAQKRAKPAASRPSLTTVGGVWLRECRPGRNCKSRKFGRINRENPQNACR